MRRSRPITFLASAGVIPLLALAVTGCGGGNAATAAAPEPSSATTPRTASTEMPAVHVANSPLGSILVDSRGRTLYLFKADTGTKSVCTGGCARAWPPLRSAGAPTAVGGAPAALLRTTARSDGTAQVTYNGHPLYLYRGDSKPGEVNGQGVVAFGAAWYAVSPAGQPVTSHSTNSPTVTTGGY